MDKQSLVQPLRQWLDLQSVATTIEHKMVHFIHNDTKNGTTCDTMNKEQFATLFWKKCSENQRYLITNHSTTNHTIIDTLVDMFTSNITDLQTLKIKKVPVVSIYSNGRRDELYDSEIQITQDCPTPHALSKNVSPAPSVNADVIVIENAEIPHIQNTNDMISIVSSCGPITQQEISSPRVPQTQITQSVMSDVAVQNAESLNQDHMKMNQNNDLPTGSKRVTLHDIAPYVSSKHIMDHLATKLSKEELIELFAKKVQINQKQHHDQAINDNSQTAAKWKLIQYNEDVRVIPNQQISSRLIKKIKKYLRKKNKLMRMEHKRQRSEIETDNAEANEDHEMKCDTLQKEKMNGQMRANNDDNLTTTITNNISFISSHKHNQNQYELSMDTFDCVHIAPSNTIQTQTSPSDFIFDTKYIPPQNTQHTNNISNWFVAPLLSSSKLKRTDIDDSTPKTEHKESEMQTMKEDSEFVPIPVIGARTAGLSYIDPSIKINENNLMLQFPNTHNFEENEEENSMLQSQCSMMMHTVHNSVNMDDFQHDIAVMDAQIANLSSLCNNIQSNYYNMNQRLNGNDDINNNITQLQTSGSEQQIGTMEAWSLLQNIQHNLDSIDEEMVAMNSIDENKKVKNKRTNQLRKIKAKTKTRRKRNAQLTKKLDQQTNLLNEIYTHLSKQT
eukprot:57267_1